MNTEVGIDQTRATARAGARLVSKLVRGHLPVFLTSVAGAAIFAAGTVLSASVLGWVVDDVVISAFEGGDPDAISSVGVGAVAVLSVAVVRAIGVVTRRYFAGMTSERVERWLRGELANQYVHQPMSWIRSIPTGRLVAHVDADSMVLTESLHPLPFSFGVIFLAIFAGIRLVAIDGWIALVAAVSFPVMMLVNTVYSRIVEKPMSGMQAQVADVAGIAHESFEGALIVKTLGRRNNEVQRFESSATDLQDRRVHVGLIRAVMDGCLNALPLLATLVVVVVGAYRIRDGAMSAGDIVEVAALFSALAIPMLVFGFLLESLIPSVVAWNRLRPVVESPLAAPVSSAEVPADAAHGVVVDALTYAWPDRPEEAVLDRVSLDIKPGEVVALVGPTGSGKSTLCAAVAGVLDEVSDAVVIDGRPLNDWPPRDRAARIAYVFQEAFLFADTIRSNIDLDGTRSHDEVVAAAKAAAIHDWIAGLADGYDTEVGERGVTVSGGQRQRVALARALVRRAGLVILDDATSAVDSLIEQQILSELRTAGGATMLIVANRLVTIERADRVLHLVDGKVVGRGTHEELLEGPEYHALVMAYAEASNG